MLHAALAADEVSLVEALEIVAQAQTLLAAVEPVVPPGPAAVMQRARQALQDGDVAAPVHAARRHLARHFQRDV